VASSGFVCNDAVVAGIDNAYDLTKVILLHEDSAIDANSAALPQGGVCLSHLTLVMDETVATCGAVSVFGTWDSAGDDIAFGPTTADFDTTPGMTDTSLRMVTIPFESNFVLRAPATQTAKGKAYLHIKTDAGTVTLNLARLHWYIPAQRG